MLKRKQLIALGVMVLLTVFLLKLPTRARTNFKLAIGGFFLPLYGAAGSADQLMNSASFAVLPRAELVRQIEVLQQTNDLLQMRFTQAEEWRKENERLRQQLGMPRQYPRPMKIARVIARDPANWWRSIKIDRGSRDGITNNAPVLAPQGLVGRVSEVGYAESQVVLVGDPDCRVAVLIADEKSREQGIITPSSSSPSDDALVDLGFISRNSKLTAGQIVVTSGQGAYFRPVLSLAKLPISALLALASIKKRV